MAGDRSQTKVARDLEISASLLHNWKQRILEQNDELAGSLMSSHARRPRLD